MQESLACFRIRFSERPKLIPSCPSAKKGKTFVAGLCSKQGFRGVGPKATSASDEHCACWHFCKVANKIMIKLTEFEPPLSVKLINMPCPATKVFSFFCMRHLRWMDGWMVGCLAHCLVGWYAAYFWIERSSLENKGGVIKLLQIMVEELLWEL